MIWKRSQEIIPSFSLFASYLEPPDHTKKRIIMADLLLSTGIGGEELWKTVLPLFLSQNQPQHSLPCPTGALLPLRVRLTWSPSHLQPALASQSPHWVLVPARSSNAHCYPQGLSLDPLSGPIHSYPSYYSVQEIAFQAWPSFHQKISFLESVKCFSCVYS